MAVFSLLPHPDHPPRSVRGLTVELAGGRDDLSLIYRVDGAEHVAWPAWLSPERADNLWTTTCFELFIMPGDGERYTEFNFSPSTRWAAYSFDRYREGMAVLERDVAPHIERLSDGIDVDCDLGGLPTGALSVALTAVIEETDGTKSYWALAHPAGKPDFHDPACFVATLPAPSGT